MTRRGIVVPRYYTTYEVAALFMVSVRTVDRWDRKGKLRPDARTPGGHRRYLADRIDTMLRDGGLSLDWTREPPADSG